VGNFRRFRVFTDSQVALLPRNWSCQSPSFPHASSSGSTGSPQANSAWTDDKNIRGDNLRIGSGNPPFILEGHRTNGGTVKLIGDFPFMLSLVEAFLGFFSRIKDFIFKVCRYPRSLLRASYGFQPLDLSSSLAFFTKLKSKMSPTLMSRCTLVVFFMSSIIDCSNLSSLNPSRSASGVRMS
jgi:hypothetical protein